MMEIQNVRSRILDTPLALLAAIKHSTKPLYGYYINDKHVSLTVKNLQFFFLIQYEAIPIARGLKSHQNEIKLYVFGCIVCIWMHIQCYFT